MLLENKIAVIYGAGGPIGSAVARAFAREGARVFLAGRTQAKLDKVADEIRPIGCVADTAIIDALDEQMVGKYVDAVVAQAGSIDISFNLISYGDVQKPLTEISVNDFMQPIMNATRTHFLTTRAAARHMVRRRSGVILMFGGNGPQTRPGLGGFKVALDAIEGLRRQWACELGQYRHPRCHAENGGCARVHSGYFRREGRDRWWDSRATLLNRAATLADVGNVAAFVA